MDKIDLKGGQKWEPAIRKLIRDSDYFLALLSKHSVTGRGQRNREIRLALEVLKELPPTEIYLIPIRLNDCELLGLPIVGRPLALGNKIQSSETYNSQSREVL